jgi:hypothetical protein
MSKVLRDKFFGSTVEEWIERLPNELSVDAVGLWQVVAFGREGFGLSGTELVDFVRRCIQALFTKGARPVVGALDNIHIWVVVDYGHSNEVDAIISEWLTSGKDLDVGGVWFALPHVYEERQSS